MRGQGEAAKGVKGVRKEVAEFIKARDGFAADPEDVFVTDGACMTSAANQNPSLTYMALTARAADHAVNELKRRNL